MKYALPVGLLLMPGVAAAAPPMTYLVSHGWPAGPIKELDWALIAVSLFVVLFIAFAVLIGIWWRRGEGDYDAEGRPVVTRGRNGMPWLMVGVPVSIMILLLSAIWTFFVLAHAAAPPGRPKITLVVTAHQWWWEVKYEEAEHPNRSFETANEIHIPVGVPVEIHLRSTDVIHSFWVPQLAGKTDAIPGQVNHAWLEAGKAGIYRGQCTQFCGLQHAHMAFYVIAQPQSAFDAWWAKQLTPEPAPAGGLATEGAGEFESRCALCHTVRGLPGNHGVLGPDLTHLMDRHTIGAGTLTNNTANLAAWVSNAPGIKPGVDMPTENLSGPQLQALLAYLKTLK
ncbi:MAG TPA: cytochrome c oxidase subunit II [Rhodanobacteraceae bacterium]|nr:cytochrome c oxidase subunit II [Rhodanobacteraceae bacterium]